MKRPPPLTNLLQYFACLRGDMPAEVLSAVDRARLVRSLHSYGWTDVQIAAHTFMTTYTAARIRSRLGLPANNEQKGAA